ncbi:MAG: UDP-N-acetylglucosamine 2-epimerase (hydrolyzing) [Rhodobacteraceae bacterium]|nr:UDP-N-acetylglucosamine 2-epimerase (hydrolyzing) [Paracoccaceae bacterium]
MIVHYVTGSRADFGLMESTLRTVSNSDQIDLGVVVTGQHLLAAYGETIRDIRASGLSVVHEIPVTLRGGEAAEMALALADELKGFVTFWQEQRPDLVLVLGDRGEMLAATLAAVHLGIHVGHIHGGELSGTLDESFRHAISKLSHFHFAANRDAVERLVAMGENPEHIWDIGAPGLVGIAAGVERKTGWLQDQFGLPEMTHQALVVFHPVVQEADQAAEQLRMIIAALQNANCGGLIMRPNSDAGGAAIDACLDALPGDGPFKVIDHLDRGQYLQCLANADVMVGNSSSGIIESASFGVPCLNIGSRQNGRLRNDNVVDCPVVTLEKIVEGLKTALALRPPLENLYGDGKTDQRLRGLIETLPLDRAILSKANCY